jgi:hypothetical protein
MFRRIVCVTAILCGRLALACSSFAFPPTVVDPKLVAFSGRVVGYSTAPGDLFGASSPSGLRVNVMEPLLSSTLAATVDVYLFGSTPDCSPRPRTVVDLTEQYPEGALVTVIARPEPLRTSGTTPVFVLVSHADDWGHVSGVPSTPPRLPDGSLNFAEFSGTFEHQPAQGYSLPLAWRNVHRQWFEDYEYLRCLLSLRGANESHKVSILRNLRSYSRWGRGRSVPPPDGYVTLVKHAGLRRASERELLRASK